LSNGGNHRSVIEEFREQRFLILLILLLTYILLAPLFDLSTNRLLIRTTLISFVLLAAIGCLRFKKLNLVTSRWFGVLTLVSGWIPVATEIPALLITSAAFRIAFFAIVTVALIYQISASTKVTLSTIIGAIDGYLLLGYMGAAGFTIGELASPGSLKSAGSALAGTDFIYYTFITMTTVGYGDIVPVAPTARSLAILIAISGQLYIAILISLLVGKYLSAKQAESSDG
jgi:voltage-gated potassium channel